MQMKYTGDGILPDADATNGGKEKRYGQAIAGVSGDS